MLGQLGQAHRVGDVAAALADDPRDVGVGVAVIGGELRVAVGLFERVEIGALDVFDDGDFERLAIAGVHNDESGSHAGRRAARRASGARRR